MAPKIKKKQSLLRVLVQWTVFSASLLIVDSSQLERVRLLKVFSAARHKLAAMA